MKLLSSMFMLFSRSVISLHVFHTNSSIPHCLKR
uniref:Uncharacterized protein n=1 Tax=Anguilla anguilla TaxID=7936 RepID=A0A0E9TT90_ANGAN